MAADREDRSEAATPRKRQEARDRGQVARSVEVNSLCILLASFGGLAFAGGHTGQILLQTMRAGLQMATPAPLTADALQALYLAISAAIGRAIAPIVLAAAGGGILANLVQVGFLVTPKALELKWDRLNPLHGLQNLLSAKGAIESLKAILKLAILSVVVWRVLRPEWDRFPSLAGMDLTELLRWELGLALRLAFRVTGTYAILAAVDYGYQRWQHEKGLRMSKGEVKEESRQQEGSPQVRARVRSVQQERRRRQMMHDVATASVVVVNPTHIAVALRYDGNAMRAPRVVAKGQRLIAERIVALAREHKVPVVQDIPLARTLFKLVDVGGEIPVGLYRSIPDAALWIVPGGDHVPILDPTVPFTSTALRFLDGSMGFDRRRRDRGG